MIIIGDVHGCYDTLMALIAKLPVGEQICFTGDLIDRGKYTKEVVEFVKSNNYDCVMGNHEDMMCNRDKFDTRNMWLNNGGEQTLSSYKFCDDLFESHCKWLEQLPIAKYYPDIKDENGNALLVSHANVGAIDVNCLDDLFKNGMFKQMALWNRPFKVEVPEGVFNVFGHTPNKEPIVKDNYANIDTGCCFNRDGYNKLTALMFPEMEIIQQEYID
jgi:serine/threonine protein phosphatase 1